MLCSACWRQHACSQGILVAKSPAYPLSIFNTTLLQTPHRLHHRIEVFNTFWLHFANEKCLQDRVCKQKAISILLSVVVTLFTSHHYYAYSCLLQSFTLTVKLAFKDLECRAQACSLKIISLDLILHFLFRFN